MAGASLAPGLLFSDPLRYTRYPDEWNTVIRRRLPRLWKYQILSVSDFVSVLGDIMSYTKILNSEDVLIVAKGHPTLADVKNVASEELHAKFLIQHDSDGHHKGLKALCYGEYGTFTGDGTTDREISLAGAIIPKVVYVFEMPATIGAETEHNILAIRTDTMSDSYFRSTIPELSPPYSLIGEVGEEGAFTVSYPDDDPGGDTRLNTDTITNYYLVLGVKTPDTYTGSELGDDPEWVEDGQQMLGGTVGTEPANRVEDYIDTQFLEEHEDDGTHTSSPFAGYMQIETGTFSGSGGTMGISLENAEMEIRELWVIRIEPAGNSAFSYTYTDGMPSFPISKIEADAAFSNTFGTVTTGYFTMATGLNYQYHWIALGD